MEKSMAPGSQTFEQALFKLFVDGDITQDEAMLNADSATNMLWLINQATAGQITSGQVSMPQVPVEPKEGDKKEGLLASGSAANFDGIKIDMTS
jgi:twitching motility protein PilU